MSLKKAAKKSAPKPNPPIPTSPPPAYRPLEPQAVREITIRELLTKLQDDVDATTHELRQRMNRIYQAIGEI